MTREETETALSALGAAEDRSFDLFEAALTCALHEDPTRDPEPVRQLDPDSTPA